MLRTYKIRRGTTPKIPGRRPNLVSLAFKRKHEI